MEQLELAYFAGGDAKWYSHLGKRFAWFLTQLNIYLPYNLAVSFLVFTQEK